MPLSIILIVLLSSVIHASWNYLAKTIPSGVLFVWLMATVTSIAYAPVFVWFIITYGFPTDVWSLVFLAGTAILHMVYFLVLQKGYQVGDLSVVYPLARGTGPLFATIGAVLFLQERISLVALAGLVLVALGVVLVAGLNGRMLGNKKAQAGVCYGVLTGFCIAAYTLWDGYAVRTLFIAPLLVEYVSHPLRVLTLAPRIKKRWSETRTIWQTYYRKILIISLISPLSFLLVLYALQRAPVHYVAPARELSIVLGVFLGAKLLTEEHFKRRMLGSLLIVLGIGLLSFYK